MGAGLDQDWDGSRTGAGWQRDSSARAAPQTQQGRDREKIKKGKRRKRRGKRRNAKPRWLSPASPRAPGCPGSLPAQGGFQGHSLLQVDAGQAVHLLHLPQGHFQLGAQHGRRARLLRLRQHLLRLLADLAQVLLDALQLQVRLLRGRSPSVPLGERGRLCSPSVECRGTGSSAGKFGEKLLENGCRPGQGQEGSWETSGKRCAAQGRRNIGKLLENGCSPGQGQLGSWETSGKCCAAPVQLPRAGAVPPWGGFTAMGRWHLGTRSGVALAVLGDGRDSVGSEGFSSPRHCPRASLARTCHLCALQVSHMGHTRVTGVSHTGVTPVTRGSHTSITHASHTRHTRVTQASHACHGCHTGVRCHTLHI